MASPLKAMVNTEDGAEDTLSPRRRENNPVAQLQQLALCAASIKPTTLLFTAIICCSLAHAGLAAAFFVQHCVMNLVSTVLSVCVAYAIIDMMLSSRPNRRSIVEKMAPILAAVLFIWFINDSSSHLSGLAATYADAGKERGIWAFDYANSLRRAVLSPYAAQDGAMLKLEPSSSTSEAIYIATKPDGSACRGALNSTKDAIHYTYCLLHDVGRTETTERISTCACRKSLRSLQRCILGSVELQKLALKDRAVTKITSCAP